MGENSDKIEEPRESIDANVKKKPPKVKREGAPSATVRVRVPGWVLAKARELKPQGRYKEEYENEFFGYLMELGTQRYEKVFLPLEKGEDLIVQSREESGRGLRKDA